MVTLQDVYYNVDSEIVEKGFHQTDKTGKKNLLEDALKNYLSKKISEVDSTKKLPEESKKEVSVNELAELLGELIPEENHFDTMRHLTHYVLGIASFMQGWAITWWTEDDLSYIDSPLIEFNIDGKWDSLKTHEKTSYVKTFEFANEVLNQIVLGQGQKQKQLTITPKQLPKGDK